MDKLENIFLEAIENEEPQSLYRPIKYVLMQSGKRIRPKLLLLGTELFGGDPNRAYHVAAAFEMLHNFTLIHDDIMDKAPIRRGKETVCRKWNDNVAILSGDALATMAVQQILKSETDDTNKLKLIDLFAHTSVKVCEGQQYDLDFETSSEVTIDDYINMIRLKTAVMLAGCLKAGAMFAYADESWQTMIYEFGIDLGIAFQLKDDLLDLYSDQDVFGKMKGVDIKDNKKTYLFLRALQDASEQDQKTLQSLFATAHVDFEEKFKTVVEIYERLDIKEKTEELIKDYVQKALAILDQIPVSQEKKEPLINVTLQLCYREK